MKQTAPLPIRRVAVRWILVLGLLAPWSAVASRGAERDSAGESASDLAKSLAGPLESLRLAIHDLLASYPEQYPHGHAYLQRLDSLAQRLERAEPGARDEFVRLQREALLANPLLVFDRLILLKRQRGQLGLPTSHQCNTALQQDDYDNEIATLSPLQPGGSLQTLYRPPGRRFVGELDLHFDADRLLFTMPNGQSWQIYEIATDGSGLRQVTRDVPDVDNFDACYLPDGRIVYVSTASFTAVPCWHGKERACSLYSMQADGSGVRQLGFDQDLDLHPAVLGNGQVIYSRWDYSGTMHIYLRPLMAMNPDGSLQRAVYGSNSYYPNSLYFPRAVPGHPTKVAAILSGYHGVNRMGELVLLDTARGWHGADGIIARIGHRGVPPVPVIRDDLVSSSWPKFLHPYPLSDKYFLAAVRPTAKSSWGIYLVDVFDNLLPLAVDAGYDFFEPLPLQPRPRPPVLPERVDLTRREAVVYLHNVYAGPGLAGVPRGAVKRLRIVAYHYGYPGMAGPDKVGWSGPWEVMRILGTVPVEADGSAAFRVPACTPISVQPLDDCGRALALMRSWYTAMPGETAACVGCHETPREAPVTRRDMAAVRPPADIEPWYGPPRGFDFEREVQPVLDQYCVGCHDGRPDTDGRPIVDLRGERFATAYTGLPLSKLGASRLEPGLRQDLERFAAHAPEHPLIGDRRIRYTPAYESLVPLIRRVNIEDYVGLHVPGEYHANTSELVQLLEKGHYNVQLDDESWERLATWIDLNGPCHGTWGDIAPIPHAADLRRRELAEQYGGPQDDPEAIPDIRCAPREPIVPAPAAVRQPVAVRVPGWPCDAAEAQRRQRRGQEWQQTIELGPGVSLDLVRIPAGSLVMGADDGDADEYPPSRVELADDFWIGVCEITNDQFRQFAPAHFSGYFMKRSLNKNGPGIDLDGPQQPAVRVSWQQAMAFCAWLSQRAGRSFTLPSEAQWEYACRAGTASRWSCGDGRADFSAHANVADARLAQIHDVTGGVVLLQNLPADARFDDGALATADVGSYQPNAWGLYDMHGNAAEWTRSAYRPYPYGDEVPGDVSSDALRVVRGGSFYDRPHRCRSGFRLSYPAWQRVHNVGFRVVCE